MVHPDKPYRMMSVAKFPQALKILSMIQHKELPEDYQFEITAEDMKQGTFSTLPSDHPETPFRLSVEEVLGYAIGQSDNVTSNRMFEVAGGPDSVERFVRSLGIQDIGIRVDYWHLNDETAYYNWSTPRAMALLLEKFYQGKILDETRRQILLEAMINGPSGKNRIRGLMPEGVRVAHKTGTGNTDDATGRIMALNDVGIIELQDNRHITLAIFISDSFEGDDSTERLIADIARVAYDYYMVK
jgi:beta-lactamase class A